MDPKNIAKAVLIPILITALITSLGAVQEAYSSDQAITVVEWRHILEVFIGSIWSYFLKSPRK